MQPIVLLLSSVALLNRLTNAYSTPPLKDLFRTTLLIKFRLIAQAWLIIVRFALRKLYFPRVYKQRLRLQDNMPRT